MSKMSATASSLSSIPLDAAAILKLLIDDHKLKMPAAVTRYVSSVTFTPEVDPILPTPLKMSESASAMWACLGLFASAICRQRYNSPEPRTIEVDVYAATLMLCSVFLFQSRGKPFAESQLMPRAIHLDKWNNREIYRNLVSNM